MESLIGILPFAALVLDSTTGKVASLNRAARQLVGKLVSDSQPWPESLGSFKCRGFDGQEIPLDESGLPRELSNIQFTRVQEIVLAAPSGRSLPILLSAAPMRSASGRVESVVVVMHDLTPIREIDGERAGFLGMISQELRAPLATIKGSAATVRGASPGLNVVEMLQFFRIIEERADQMHALISDLLDVDQVETDTLSVSPTSTEVADLVEQARNAFFGDGRERMLAIDLPLDLPRVMADAPRIVQVLNKLLSNAVRHSLGSSPIRIKATQEGHEVALSVTHDGKGLQPDLLRHLFQKYTNFRSNGANAMGLAICKGLVEAHGGRIWALSGGLDQGACFTFTLPAATELGIPITTGSLDPDSPSKVRQRRRILVLDDDPHTLRNVREALASAGYAPIVTGDPGKLAHLLRSKKPDLVLLDLMLPGADGIELMERTSALADLPVIFISAYRRGETIAKALEMGAADFLVKPFSSAELVARVQAALRREVDLEPFRLGDLAIQYEDRQVTVSGRPVELTAIEFEFLRVLSSNAGRVLTHDSLLNRVWSYRDYGDTGVIRTIVKQLRRKLGDKATQPTYILNERGVGYRMPNPNNQ